MAQEMTYDNLVGAEAPRTFTLELKSGQDVVRGQVVAYETTSGSIVTYDSGGSNGADKFYGIAAEDVDASGGAKPIVVYIRGEFNKNALIFSESGDEADQAFINEARALGCLIRTFAAG